MVDLSAGRYQTVISPVDIGAFLNGLCNGAASFLCEDTTATLREDYNIAFDEKIAVLAMENGVTNSLAHGKKEVSCMVPHSTLFKKPA